MSAKIGSVLQWSLLAGSAYCLLVALAHLAHLNPPLFVGFPIIPHFTHQNLLVASLALAWSLCLFAAWLSLRKMEQTILRYVLIGGSLALLAMILGNLSMAAGSEAVARQAQGQWPRIVLAAAYLGWLSYLRLGLSRQTA
jgi:hypothetical protein